VTRPAFSRLPRHIAVIPDGNRRWAQAQHLGKDAGYAFGVDPGLALLDLCIALGIEEITSYGFTLDNTKRPAVQRAAFQQACIAVAQACIAREVSLLVVGNTDSPMFPNALRPYTTRQTFGRGRIRANLLVNYDWQWDLRQLERTAPTATRRSLHDALGSADISRVDLLIRWGGRRRLSGMLPVQTVYADIYVLDSLWPDFHPDQFYEALRWYEGQDVTLGG
jgi:undecaprenyl diphosphate synthase